jgi:hypothetical protein
MKHGVSIVGDKIDLVAALIDFLKKQVFVLSSSSSLPLPLPCLVFVLPLLCLALSLSGMSFCIYHHEIHFCIPFSISRDHYLRVLTQETTDRMMETLGTVAQEVLVVVVVVVVVVNLTLTSTVALTLTLILTINS